MKALAGALDHAVIRADSLSNPLMSKPLNLIVACAENRVIGRAGQLPFGIPEDKKWFQNRTAGAVVVLGRICYETWPRVLADGRRAVVISSQPANILTDAKRRFGAGALERLQVCPDVPAALIAAQSIPGEIMTCGGQRIYEETLPLADRLLLTLVHADVEGDTWFPEWRQLSWRESWRKASADANYSYTISVLDRVR
jgi:dihydrofolate reductase